MHQIGSLGIGLKSLPYGGGVSPVLRLMVKQWIPVGVAILLFFLALGAAAAQEPGKQQPDSKQDIPDAPSASRPPQPFPPEPPIEPQGAPPSEAPAAEQPPSANEAPPTSSKPPASTTEDNPPPHSVDVKTPEGAATPDSANGPQADLY